MTSNEALKPCPVPWCRGTGEVRSYGGFQVVCQGHVTKDGDEVSECGGCEGPERATPEEAIAAWNTRSTDTPVCASTIERLREAVANVVERKAGTFKARNGREVGIEGDDGEKCWIVHSDEMTALEAALSSIPEPLIMPLEGGADA